MATNLTPEQKAALTEVLRKRNAPALPTVDQTSAALQGTPVQPQSAPLVDVPSVSYTPPAMGQVPGQTVSKPEDRLSLEEYVAWQKAQPKTQPERSATAQTMAQPNPTKSDPSLQSLVDKVKSQLPSTAQQDSGFLPTFQVPQETLALEQGQNPFLRQSESNYYSPEYPSKTPLDGVQAYLNSPPPSSPPPGDIQTVEAPDPGTPQATAPDTSGGLGSGQTSSTGSSLAVGTALGVRDPRTEIASHQQMTYDELIDAQKKQNDLAAQRSVEVSDLATEQRDAEEQAMVLAKAQKLQDDTAIQAAVKHRMEAIDSFNASTIDPDRFWKERGDAARIAGALAVGFGAFAQAYSGGKVPNTPLDVINKMIDRDIRAQEMDIEKKGKSIDIASNSLAMQRQLAGDNRAAELAERGRLMDVYKVRLANLLTKYDNANFQQEGVKLISKMEAEKTAIADNLKLALYQEQQRALAAAAAQAKEREKEEWDRAFKVAGLKKDITVADIAHLNKAGDKLVNIPDPTGKIKQFSVSTEKDAEEVKNSTINHTIITNLTQQLQGMRKKNNGGSLSPADTSHARNLATQISLRLKEQYKLGVLSESDLKMLQQIVPEDPNAWSPLGTTDKKLQTIIDTENMSWRANMQVRVPGWDVAQARNVTSAKAPGK